MSAIEVKVPDIGDFKDVPVIEIFVKPGDVVKAEDSLITLESDKATMDVPSPVAGTIRELKVKLGDKLAEGAVILTLDSAAGGAGEGAAAAAPASKPAAPAPAPAAAPVPGGAAYTGKADIECEMLVLGAGPGGYSAAFRAADLGLKTVLVERYATLGGVCLNVGCIPSKALLHVAAVSDEAKALAAHGISFGAPQIDLTALRGWKDKVVGKLTGGLAGMAKSRKVDVVRGVGQFLDAHHVEVELTMGPAQDKTGEKKVVRFAKAIIAAGSQVVGLKLNGQPLPDDPRIVDSTGALELRAVPKKMLIIGGGIIGLEMGTVYSSLGARLDVVEMLDGADARRRPRSRPRLGEGQQAPLRPRDAQDQDRLDRSEARRDPRHLRRRAGAERAAALRSRAVGGRPRAQRQEDLGAKSRGRGQRARLHPGGHADAHQRRAHLRHRRHRRPADARAQGGARGARRSRGRRRAEVALRRAGDPLGRLHRSGSRVGRRHRGRGEGPGHQGREGAVSVDGLGPRDRQRPRRGPHQAACSTPRRTASSAAASSARTPGDLIGEIALAIEMGADAVDIGKTIHPHPTLCESVGLAAEAFEGVCTDLPPVRKKAH